MKWKLLVLIVAFPLLALGQSVLGPMYRLATIDESLFPRKTDGGTQYQGAIVFGTDAGRVYVNDGVDWQRLPFYFPDGGIN